MGVCPSRNHVVSNSVDSMSKVAAETAANKVVTNEVVVNTKSLKANKDATIAVEATTAPTVLPVRSWRELLKEAPLNGEAEASHQQGAPVAKQAPRVLAPPPGLSNRTRAELSAPRNISKLGRAGGLADVAAVATSAPAFTVVNTSAYLQLLKEGGSKKKPRGPDAGGRTKAAVDGVQCEPTGAAPMSRLKLAALPALVVHEEGKDKPKDIVVQDDIQVEKLSVDEDLSDPAYWSEDLTYNLDRSVGMLLLRLQRYNDQQRMFKQDKGGQRRFVIGLKEVSRRVKQLKVSCLVVAPDLEGDASEGGLDDRMREILAVAYKNRIPVIFALSRMRIGKAVGKNMAISVLGVLDATGAKDLLENAVDLAHDAREVWLARLSKK